MFLGWYDPDKKKPVRQKLEEAVERYVEKFGARPITCLTSVADAPDLAAVACDLDVKGVTFIPRFTFYIGVEDDPVAPLAEAA